MRGFGRKLIQKELHCIIVLILVRTSFANALSQPITDEVSQDSQSSRQNPFKVYTGLVAAQ